MRKFESTESTIMLGELSKQEIDVILESNVVGRIGCCAGQQMYVVPITYVYDGQNILGHTVEGMKVDILRKNPACCFEVDIVKSINEWQSVIAWGTYEELEGEESEKAMQQFVDKVSPVVPVGTNQPQRMGPSSAIRSSTFVKNPIVYRIRLTEKSGRYEQP